MLYLFTIYPYIYFKINWVLDQIMVRSKSNHKNIFNCSSFLDIPEFQSFSWERLISWSSAIGLSQVFKWLQFSLRSDFRRSKTFLFVIRKFTVWCMPSVLNTLDQAFWNEWNVHNTLIEPKYKNNCVAVRGGELHCVMIRAVYALLISRKSPVRIFNSSPFIIK